MPLISPSLALKSAKILGLGSVIAACPLLSIEVRANQITNQADKENPKSESSEHGAEKVNPQIVVTGRPYGQEDVPTDQEFDADVIASFGANSIQDVLAAVQASLIYSDQNPVILINGKPSGSDLSILKYPPEALSSVAVLKHDGDARYGAAPGGRVINLILKKRFNGTEANIGASAATAGGYYGQSYSVTETVIRGDLRWNGSVEFDHQTPLLHSARYAESNSDVVETNNYVTTPDGQPVNGSNSKTISSDILSTLLPEVNTKKLNMNFAMPVGKLSASLTIDASENISLGSGNIPQLIIDIPANNYWSTFGSDVVLQRPFSGLTPLRYSDIQRSLGTSFVLNGNIRGIQSNLALNFSRSEGRDYHETGIDTASIQTLVSENSANFNPFTSLGNQFIQYDGNYSNLDNYSSALTLQRRVLRMPAGETSMSTSVSFSHAQSSSVQTGTAASNQSQTASTYNQLDEQLSLNIPISHRGSHFSSIGDLDLGFSIGESKQTGAPDQLRFGSVFSWALSNDFRINGSFSRSNMSPSATVLYAPIVTTTMSIYDYKTGNVENVNWITGGNPDLKSGKISNISLSVAIKPKFLKGFSAHANYTDMATTGGSSAFPNPTPAVEAALPDRFVRNSDGELTSIDARPINIKRNETSDLSGGISFNITRRNKITPGHTKFVIPHVTVLSLSINYKLHLTSKLVLGNGIPDIDRIANGGESRDSINANINLSKSSFGLGITGDLSRKFQINSGTETYTSIPPLRLSARVFVNFDKINYHFFKSIAFKNLVGTLSVQNVTDSYQRIVSSSGSIAPDFNRYALDPIGRSINLSIKKRI